MRRLIFLALLATLGGCTGALSVHSTHWKEAEKLCKANGGVKRIQRGDVWNSTVVCNNSARFTFKTEKGYVL